MENVAPTKDPELVASLRLATASKHRVVNAILSAESPDADSHSDGHSDHSDHTDNRDGA